MSTRAARDRAAARSFALSVRKRLAERLRGRRHEIEQETLTRIHAIAGPVAADPSYSDGLRVAVTAALDYGLSAVETGDGHSSALPPALLAQARTAARSGVPLDIVLRRYFAGQALFSDFIIDEAEKGGLLTGDALQLVLRGQAVLFDRLVAMVSEEYAREPQAGFPTTERRLGDLVEHLLAGELIDSSHLDYDLTGRHVGVVAAGGAARDALRGVASRFDRRLLSVTRADGTIWGWLGTRRDAVVDELARALASSRPSGTLIALGEPGLGLAGWRTTHWQARAVFPVASRGAKPVVRYSEAALLAAMMQDHLLTRSLYELYLAPLEDERDGGEAIRKTLRAYLASRCNIASAAAAIEVNRNTVANRLRTVERRIGRPVQSCVAELDLALRYEALEEPDQGIRPSGQDAHAP